jgi:hypothetical protein
MATWKASNKEFTIEIGQDPYADSPRMLDNMCSMVTWHRNMELCENNVPMDDYDGPTDVLEQFVKDNNKNVRVYCPVYAYQHSGITLSLTPFSCPWDSGQVGWIWVTEEGLREYGREDCSHDFLYDLMKAEVEALDQYLQGDVYEVFVTDNETGEQTDYCGSFYTTDWNDNGMHDFLADINPELPKLLDGLKEEV